MNYAFPPDVARLVNEQLASHGFRTEDEVLREALRVFRDLQTRRDELLADVRLGIEQADGGQARPLDIEALIARCTAQLADEGIRD